MAQIRIDKYLADMGIGTRSEVKKILKSGQVTLNGEKIKEPLEAGKWYKTSLGKYDVVLDNNKNQGEDKTDKPDDNKANNKADNSEEQDQYNKWNPDENPDEEIQNPSDEFLENMELQERDS